ncbi:MAG TPA: flagellar motor protein [Nitrospiria bacterium]|nr:flagellar motor protein [Nitrospiria bacterium]
MDFFTILGVVFGLLALLGGQIIEGGNVHSLLQFTAMMIVLGGTFGAVMVQYPASKFFEAMKFGFTALKNPSNNSKDLIAKIVDYAAIVRKQGILALESKIKQISDPFFRKGVQLLLDGTEPGLLRQILEVDSAYSEEHLMAAAKVFESAGGYAPTFGIIGAVMGLIHVMENLADPGKLGAGIAVAFVATIYGVGSANLIFLPLSGKLKFKTRMEGITRELIVEGLLSIAAGENPRMIQEKLEGFLAEVDKKGLKKK